MRELSKVLTAFVFIGAAGCARTSPELVLQPGPEGTMIALGADVQGSLEADGVGFNFKKVNGLSVGVATGGPEPITRSESSLFRPASITKLVTTTLGLQTLGRDFHFTTDVFVGPVVRGVAQGLTLMADGDPQAVRALGAVTGVEHDSHAEKVLFESLANELRRLGVSRISGTLHLVSLDPRHDAAVPADGMEVSDHTTCFGAVSQSFNFNWNCGGLRRGHWVDRDLEFPLQVGSQILPLFENTGRVAGFTVTSSGEWSLPISDAKSWYGKSLLSFLSANGIATDDVVIQAGSRPNAQPTFSLASDSLSELIAFTNKPSDNFLADDIFKTVAARHGDGEDLRAEGRAAIAEYVSDLLRAAGHAEFAEEIHLIDGAGLSHENRVSARAYLALLEQFTRQPWFPALWNSLPIAGVDGTLKNRMEHSRAVGLVRAKTGTLKGSYQLAGYIPRLRADGTATEFIPFVILSSVDPSKKFDVFKLQESIATQLLKLVN